jgi:putative DNA primase/helicase
MTHSLTHADSTPESFIPAFAQAVAEAGLGWPEIIADGEIHRFHVDGDRSNTQNGYCLLALFPRPWGFYGTWRDGELIYWYATRQAALTPEEDPQLRENIERAKREHQQEQAQQWQQASEFAAYALKKSRLAPADHPYLVKKGVQPHEIRVDPKGNLLIPIVDEQRHLLSLQVIDPDGSKRFLPHGRTKGGFFLIEGRHASSLLICEGFATGATLHEATGCPVVIAFSCHNLEPVTQVVQRLHPRARIILGADNDQWTDGNPGVTHAVKVARQLGVEVLIPDFAGMDVSTKPTDWNDWYRLRRQAQEVVS